MCFLGKFQQYINYILPTINITDKTCLLFQISGSNAMVILHPLLVDLFIYSYEADFVHVLKK